MNEARRPLIAGNWKMNGLAAAGLALARDVAGRRGQARSAAAISLLCPPATLMRPVAEAVAGAPIAVGGQDCHAEPSGAHTGDIAADDAGRCSAAAMSSSAIPSGARTMARPSAQVRPRPRPPWRPA